MFKKILKYTVYILVIINLYLLFNYYYIQTSNISNLKYFRLHVTANSNSVSDQIIKYKVANNVFEYINSLKLDNLEKYDIKETINNNLSSILEISTNVLEDERMPYTVKALVGNIYYTQREKKNNGYAIEMAKGNYDSINIVLGDGLGKNFWSLLYPYSYNSFSEITYDDSITQSSNIVIDNDFLLDEENSSIISYDSYFFTILKKMFKT